jgi:hypothetical protein
MNIVVRTKANDIERKPETQITRIDTDQVEGVLWNFKANGKHRFHEFPQMDRNDIALTPWGVYTGSADIHVRRLL